MRSSASSLRVSATAKSPLVCTSATKQSSGTTPRFFAKLGVSSRDEAVEQAQARRLFSNKALSSAARHNLRQQLTPFIGRQRELAEIARLLAQPELRLLTILAPGGMGKTRLALAAAEAQLSHFPDGVFFIPLAPLSSAEDIVATIADSLGLSFYGSDPPERQLIGFLQSRVMLLLLDNFEHLLEAAPLVTAMLQAAPRLKVLATSREKLKLSGETVLNLAGLHFPPREPPANAHEYDAVRLFLHSAQRSQPDFSLKAANRDALAQICRLTEGMPLGLELAAAWVDVLSLEQIADELQQGIDILESDLRDVPARHRSLRACFEQTWSRLSADEQFVFARLSVFRGGFDSEAAQAVAAATLRQLRKLVDKALLQLASESRYDLHELLRQYAAEKLAEMSLAESTADRHLDFFIALTDEAEKHHFGQAQTLWFNRIEADLENIRAALAWSLEAAASARGLQLASLMSAFWSVRNYVVEGQEWMNRLLAVNQDAPPELRARALYHAARHSFSMGLTKEARSYAEDAVVLSRSLEEPTLTAWSLLNLGGILIQSAELSRAAALFDESLALFRALEDLHGVNNILRLKSEIAIRQGDFAQARHLLDEVIRHSAAGGHAVGLGHGFELLGLIAWTTGEDLALTRRYLQDSIAHYQEAGARLYMSRVQVSLGLAEYAAGNHREAQHLCEQSYQQLKQMGHLRSPLFDYLLYGQGIAAREQGRYQGAAQLFAAAEAGIRSGSFWLKLTYVSSYDQDLEALRHQLGESTFAEAWAAGKAMTRDQAVAYAMETG